MAVAFVIQNGHHPELAWRYTPRELQGWMDFYIRLQAGRDAELLALMALAHSGDSKAVTKFRNELLKTV